MHRREEEERKFLFFSPFFSFCSLHSVRTSPFQLFSFMKIAVMKAKFSRMKLFLRYSALFR